MKKIVMLPLDERPCNFDFPQMMPKADYQLVLPPKEYMGDKKIPADTDRLAGWLLENIEGADACILSMDTLIYGGIVPSRLHHEELPELFRRAATVEALRKKNPTMQFYVFQLIMRCPDYSLSDEEHLLWIKYADGKTTYELYDDGFTTDVREENIRAVTV